MDNVENAVEREKSEKENQALRQRVAELERSILVKNDQLSIATQGEGVNVELAKDIDWRMSTGGLSRAHATTAAYAQLANDIANKKKEQEEAAKEASKAAPTPAPLLSETGASSKQPAKK